MRSFEPEFAMLMPIIMVVSILVFTGILAYNLKLKVDITIYMLIFATLLLVTLFIIKILKPRW